MTTKPTTARDTLADTCDRLAAAITRPTTHKPKQAPEWCGSTHRNLRTALTHAGRLRQKHNRRTYVRQSIRPGGAHAYVCILEEVVT